MLTSWNFVFVTDFASYKPVYLSESNPTEYTFLFDTSHRRVCYTATERFYKSQDIQFIDLSDEGEWCMDVFSLGCVVLELCLDGKPLYVLSGNTAIGKPDNQAAQATINEIGDPHVREMVSSMIAENPTHRHTPEYYINKYFPEPHYAYLMQLMEQINSTVNATADYIITDMHRRWADITSHLGGGAAEWSGNSYVILLSLYTAFLPHLASTEAKYTAFDLFKLFEPRLNASVFFERTIPHIFMFFEDADSNVSSEAINLVTDYLIALPSCLSQDILLDYIIPTYHNLCHTDKPLIRLALAARIGDLFEMISRQLSKTDFATVDSQFEMSSEYFGDMVIALLTTRDSSIYKKISETDSHQITESYDVIVELLRSSMAKIFDFFGEERFCVTIMPHIINLAHTKDCWEVRAEFFRVLPGIFNQLYDTSCMLLPLFEAGLSDCEEFVIHETIDCIEAILDKDMLDTGLLLSLLKRIIPFLIHPNTMIRTSAIHFVHTLSRRVGFAFSQCVILPHLDGIVAQRFYLIEDAVTFARAIAPPIARDLIDCVTKSSNDPGVLFSVLETRVGGANEDWNSIDAFHDLSSTLKRTFQQMTFSDVSLILKLKTYFLDVLHRSPISDSETDLYKTISLADQLVQLSSNRVETSGSQGKYFPNDYSAHLHQFLCNKREENMFNELRRSCTSTCFRASEGTFQGTQLTTLLYHDAPVHCLSADYNGNYFVSASSDSKYCIWSIADILGGSYTPIADVCAHPRVKEPLFVEHFQHDRNFVVLSQSGMLHIYDVEKSTKTNVTTSVVPDSGKAVGISVCGDSCANGYVIALTSHGALSMIDLRVPKPISLDFIPLKYGRCSCFDVDYSKSWLVVGTGHGNCVCWDIRFRSPFSILTPADHVRRAVRSVIVNPLDKHGVIASYNSDNSIMLWNVPYSHVSTGITTIGDIDNVRCSWKKNFISRMVNYEHRQQSMLLTVGSDMRIRNWNLSNISQSKVLSMGWVDSSYSNISYSEKNYPEFSEIYEKNIVDETTARSRNRDRDLSGHRSIITDIKLLISNTTSFLLTSSYDKTVKIWN
ncbi:phosphoinositide 3-kinase regulatory subunit 4-like [Octopus sinensis]|uniref:non-specific serine/threonine protein kinase n=1 Tax=Octopus sinensis TaxID=2607531 RepID=A0A6P7TY27_9MOLL|nr:phosphoinositide 3-kinase regulatory subunit 4-like [Octopus sinensis]